MPEVKKVNSKLKGHFIANNVGQIYFISKDLIVDPVDDPQDKDNDIEDVVNVPEEWLTGEYPKIASVGESSYIWKENSVYGFGYNEYGQLGLGDTSNRIVPTEIHFFNGEKIVNILSGQFHVYAISKNGDVYSFGKNDFGQLGLGNNLQQNIPVKNEILSSFDSKNIKTKGEHNLLLEKGKVYAWGLNDCGQLGLGDTINRNTPTEITFFSTNNIEVKDVFAGHYHSFATTTDNKLYVWGKNSYGQLGLGNNINQLTPVELTFFRGVPIKDIKTNNNSTFVLTEAGKLYSFGLNDYGQLGLGNTTNRNTPQLVNVVGKLIDEVITGSDMTFVRLKDGIMYGWGKNLYLLLGGSQKISSPVLLTGLNPLNPQKVELGSYHLITKTQSGEIYVCGKNNYGQLGMGHQNNIFPLIKLAFN